MSSNAEQVRLDEARARSAPWKKWGPYLSERQWGTVREDYSEDGDAWNYFTHDQARSRAYRWGEDGIAGISDDAGLLCFALALWNGHDPILKERLFGLEQQRGQPRRGCEGVLLLPRQHAHPFLHALPLQVSPGGLSLCRPDGDQPPAQPRGDGVRAARYRRVRRRPLLRRVRGVCQGLARTTSWCGSPRSTAARSPPSCTCCRRSGSATIGRRGWPSLPRSPSSRRSTGPAGVSTVAATHPELGTYNLYCAGEVSSLLFTENETNNERLFPGYSERQPVRQRRHQQPIWSTGRRRRSTPTGAAPRSPRTTTRRSPPASRRRCGCACRGRMPASGSPPQSSSRQHGSVRGLRRDVHPAPGRGRRVLPLRDPARHLSGRGRRHAPGACRHALEQATLHLQRRPVAGGAPRPPAAARQPLLAATGSGSTWSTTTSSRCPTSGSIPGTRPGISPSTRSRSRSSTPTSPRSR